MSARFTFLAKRFVAGETIEAGLAVARALNADGLAASLDFLGEEVTHEADARAYCATYIALLDAIRQADVRANVSLKLTALGLAIDEELCVNLLSEIVAHAAANPDPFVRIDMEGSAHTEKTLAIFERVHAEHANVGPVIQAALKRSPVDIEHLIALGARVRLCKGAYREPEIIAHRDPAVIQRAYLRLAEALLSRGRYPAIATHDLRLIQAVRAYASEHSLSPESFEFQMLYGIRPQLQRELVRAGYGVRVYVPFGTSWVRYFSRRITERRENALFALRAIFSR